MVCAFLVLLMTVQPRGRLGLPTLECSKPVGGEGRVGHLYLRPERRLPLRAAQGVGQEPLDPRQQPLSEFRIQVTGLAPDPSRG